MIRASRLVALGLVAAGGGGYVLHTQQVTGDVEVRTGEPTCTGTDLRRDGAIRAREGMRCRVEVTVANGSGRDVEVGTIRFPFLGPGGGAVVRSGELDGYPSVAADTDIDEVLAVESTLEAGSSLIFRMLIVFRPSGCSGPGGTTTFGEFPSADITYLGRTRTVASEGELVFTQAGPAAGCRDRAAQGGGRSR